MIDVLAITCPNCQAVVGAPCTAPTDSTRRDVKRVHLSRIQAASDAEHLGYPDMSEVFQWDAELAEEARKRYPDLSGTLRRQAFIDGANWGSRPF